MNAPFHEVPGPVRPGAHNGPDRLGVDAGIVVDVEVSDLEALALEALGAVEGLFLGLPFSIGNFIRK